MKTNDSTRGCPKCGAPIPADAPQGLCPRCVLAEAATVQDAGRPGPVSTGTSELPSLDRVRAAFPQLEVLELIGRGGMGYVFKARQPRLDRLVALKLLPDKLARDPQFTERFNREGRVLARLNHPNIVSVFDFGRTEHFYFLTLEFVDGVNLRQAMQAGRFSPSEALGIVPKICEALQYAHEQGVLHRDIKPENILLDARGRVKIADFGIAKLVEDDPASVTLTGTGAALGTPHYMAPEQLETPAEVDHRADIYSLGVVFYEMLTGELPLGRFAPPSAKTPVNSHVDDVVFRTLEKDREKRFQSAGEVKTQVEHLTDGGAANPPMTASLAAAASGPPPGSTRVPNRPRFSGKAISGAVLAGLALLLLGGPTALVLLAGGGISLAELLVVGVPGGLCALASTILGWLALNDIRDSRGAVRGLPLAVFAATTWPLLALVGVALGLPWLLLVPAGGSGWLHALGRGLVLLLPAGVLTFALWAVHATTRWAAGQPPLDRRKVLKWIFASLLGVGLGFALMFRQGGPEAGLRPPTPVVEYTAARPADTEPSRVQFQVPQGHIAQSEARGSNAMVQTRLTVTGVAWSEDAGARWLALNYVANVDPNWIIVFRAEASGFETETRSTRLFEGRAGGQAVRHERAEVRLPAAFAEADAAELRDELAQALVAQPVDLPAGREIHLFKLPVGDLGLLSAIISARPASP